MVVAESLEGRLKGLFAQSFIRPSGTGFILAAGKPSVETLGYYRMHLPVHFLGSRFCWKMLAQPFRGLTDAQARPSNAQRLLRFALWLLLSQSPHHHAFGQGSFQLRHTGAGHWSSGEQEQT